jgi:hypothetical protein
VTYFSNAPVCSPLAVDGGPCPTYFRACCSEAARGRTKEGAVLGYDHPGYHLTIHLESECPYEVDEFDWQNAISELVDLIYDGADVKIVEWYMHWLPSCMALVPRRRRRKFVEGVYRAAHHNGWIG